jgi:DNA-binding response OmpR family regulator
MLPDTDGFEVCRQLHEDEKTRDVPVVFLTAMDREEQKQKGRDCGAVKYMTKPFDPDQLMSTIRDTARHNGRGAR